MAKEKVPFYMKETPEERKKRIALQQKPKVVPSKKTYKRVKKIYPQ